MYKKFNCSEINNKMIGKTIVLQGWVKQIRKLGSLVFFNVSDRWGEVQIKMLKENLLENLNREDVVQIEGIVIERLNKNDSVQNGDIEIDCSVIKILSKSETPPLIIENETDALEDVRYKYRYLDLRRPIIKDKLIKRSKFISALREFLDKKDFIEIETPILTKSTPEGARDYVVPSRVHKGKFFALPQSPQIYKQLLMVSGFEKYYQVAKAFRDEDLRSDRQPEFTQLDMEFSFHDELEIRHTIEEMMKHATNKVFGLKHTDAFPIITYNDAMEKYGIDKPDIRFKLEIEDLSSHLKLFNVPFFNKVLDNKNGAILGLRFNNKNNKISKNKIKELEGVAKQNGSSGLTFIANINNELSSPISKFLDNNQISKLIENLNLKDGDTYVIVADKKPNAQKALGPIRNILGNELGLINHNEYKFCWIVDWPLFEVNSEGNLTSAHHPFTKPDEESIISGKLDENTRAQAYDLVLNGYEVGGGSIRIIDPKLQNEIFRSLGLTDKQIQDKFGFFINAFKYGVPPHGGCALGLDRLIMILTNSNSIREVIAFPKTQFATDLMLNCPDKIEDSQLKELGIEVKND